LILSKLLEENNSEHCYGFWSVQFFLDGCRCFPSWYNHLTYTFLFGT